MTLIIAQQKRMRDSNYSAFRIDFSTSDLRLLDFDYAVKSRLTLALPDARSGCGVNVGEELLARPVKPFGGGPRGCGGRGPYANSIVGRDGFELRRSCAAEHDPSHRGPRKWLQAIAQRSVRRARRWCVRRSNAACTAAVRGHPALLAERDFSCAGRSVRCHAAASVFAVDRCRKLCQRSPAPVSALAGRGGEAALPGWPPPFTLSPCPAWFFRLQWSTIEAPAWDCTSRSKRVRPAKFYRDLKQREIRVRVGRDATGYSRWLERLLAEFRFRVVDRRSCGDQGQAGEEAEVRPRRCSTSTQTVAGKQLSANLGAGSGE